jgi:hypothetical protein
MSETKFQACITACKQCQEASGACAQACIRNPNVREMLRCIALNRDCGLFCNTALLLLEHGSEFLAQTCGLLAEICDVAAREAAKFDLPECKREVLACARCAAECRLVLGLPHPQVFPK